MSGKPSLQTAGLSSFRGSREGSVLPPHSFSGSPRWSWAVIRIIAVPPLVGLQLPSFKDTGYIKLSGPRQGLELGRLLKLKGQENQESAVPSLSQSLEAHECSLPAVNSFFQLLSPLGQSGGSGRTREAQSHRACFSTKGEGGQPLWPAGARWQLSL